MLGSSCVAARNCSRTDNDLERESVITKGVPRLERQPLRTHQHAPGEDTSSRSHGPGHLSSRHRPYPPGSNQQSSGNSGVTGKAWDVPKGAGEGLTGQTKRRAGQGKDVAVRCSCPGSCSAWGAARSLV